MAIVTDSATALMRELRAEVRQHNKSGRLILAVDGRDGAGKTTFADSLGAVFAEAGDEVYRASLDDFHRPKLERYARGRTSPEGFYRDSYDEEQFRRLLIEPFRRGSGAFRLLAFDLDADVPVEAPEHEAGPDAVLIVDGLFLHRPELRGIWNWSVWLHVPAAIAFARMAERDGTDPDPDAESNVRYRQGNAIYARDADPRSTASAIIDNSYPETPQRVFGDFC